MRKALRWVLVCGAACAALSASSEPGGRSIDWASIHGFVGHYHSLDVLDSGVRQEITGESKIPFNRAYGPAGALQLVFTGTSVASARSSGPTPSGPCKLQMIDPNRSAKNDALRIDLSINLKTHQYSWQPQPVVIPIKLGGYTPECGAALQDTAIDIGAIPIDKIDLPTDTDVLCGKATLQVPGGEDVAKVDWYFYPDDGKPRQPPKCPAVLNPGGTDSE